MEEIFEKKSNDQKGRNCSQGNTASYTADTTKLKCKSMKRPKRNAGILQVRTIRRSSVVTKNLKSRQQKTELAVRWRSINS